MSYRNAARRRHTKGVVLFTVVCILLFLFIMIMSTLSVVSSAQKRTYTKFKENQAYFTARSNLASVTTALWNYTYTGSNPSVDKGFDTSYTEKGLYQQFYDLMYSTPADRYVVTGNHSIEELDTTYSSDVVKLEVILPQPDQSGGDMKYLYGESKVYIQKTAPKKAKIISYTKLDDEESTVVLYIGPKAQTPDVFKNAITTFAGAGADNMSIYGGTSANVNVNPDDPITEDITYSNSGTTISGSGYLHANVKMTGDSHVSVGMNHWVVAGNYALENTSKVTTDYDDVKFYVGGKLSGDHVRIGSSEHSMDVYCDTFAAGNGGDIYGDLYIFDEGNVGSTIKGTIHGDVYYMGTGTLNFENATIEGQLFSNGTVTRTNGLTINSVNYNDISDFTGKFSTVSNPPTKEEILVTLPSADDTMKLYRPIDSKGEPITDPDKLAALPENERIYNAWGYKNYGDEDNPNWKPLKPENLSTYRTEDNWLEWGNILSLPKENINGVEYYILDATSNDLNIHVSAPSNPHETKTILSTSGGYDSVYGSYQGNQKILIKGSNRVSFYFDKGNYSFGNKTQIINESVLDATGGINISSTDPKLNNISVNTYMYFWGESNVYSEANLCAYLLGPQTSFTSNTVDKALPSTVTYDGVSGLQANRVTAVGSLVFNEVSAPNGHAAYFLPSKSDDGNRDIPTKFWLDLYYLNY